MTSMIKIYLNLYAYPSNAAKGQPSKADTAVANMANSYLRAYQADIATVLKYLKNIYFF